MPESGCKMAQREFLLGAVLPGKTIANSGINNDNYAAIHLGLGRLTESTMGVEAGETTWILFRIS
jgi:hypothetical protein